PRPRRRRGGARRALRLALLSPAPGGAGFERPPHRSAGQGRVVALVSFLYVGSSHKRAYDDASWRDPTRPRNLSAIGYRVRTLDPTYPPSWRSTQAIAFANLSLTQRMSSPLSSTQERTAHSFVERHKLWSDAQFQAAASTEKWIEDQALEVVRFSFPDQHGILRGKTLIASEAAATMRNGCSLTT